MNDYTAPSPRRRLTDILNGGTDSLRDAWNRTEAAGDFRPLPPGDYVAHVHEGRLFTSRSGTPGYKLTFAIADGPHGGRRLWHDIWLTPAALPMAKRDLRKLGITALEQLDRPLPPGRIRCRVRVALRRADDGTEYNRVVRFDVIGIDEPERDPFAPADGADGGDASFHFGANAKPEGGASCG